MTVGCVHCHGSMGQGSTAGTRLAPESLPAEAIAPFIRNTGTTMPAYSARVLSDADVADIAAFLATIPAARPVERIPALRDLAGPAR
jgi:mono/diheme cytochrome c family protein